MTRRPDLGGMGGVHLASPRLARAQCVPAEVCAGEAWKPSSSLCWALCGANRPVEGVLIDSFSPLSVSLSPVPREACISPGSPRSLPRVPPPSLQCDCQGTGGRESPKPGPGSRMEGGGGGGWTSEMELLLRLSELVMMMYINPPLLSPPHPHPVFTAFAV